MVEQLIPSARMQAVGHAPGAYAAESTVIPPEREHDLVGPTIADSVYYLEHGSNSRLIRWHYHEAYELHLIVDTRGTAYVGDHVGRFAPYDLVLTGPNVPHNWVSEIGHSEHVPLRDRVIQFTDAFIERCTEVFPDALDLRPLLQESRYGLHFSAGLGRRLEPQFREVAQSRGFRRLAKFLDLMAALMDDTDRRRLCEQPYGDSAGSAQLMRVRQATAFIARHCAGEVSLHAVAAQIGMAPSAFSRFFHRHTGYRFVDFVIQTRVQRACEMLVRDPASITDICFEAGFTNLSNFNRQFRRLIGMTPRDYRRRASHG